MTHRTTATALAATASTENETRRDLKKRCAFFIAAALILGAVAPRSLRAATDAENTVLNTALQAEEELTKIIERLSAAFVFVGGGSGVVVSPDGYILTNHHVAGDRRQWTVRIEGTGKLTVCDLVGTDPVGDLCLLKARDAKDLPYVEFGDIAQVKVGQQVLAVGDPFKLAELDGPPSFSIGLVSALHRFQGNYSDAIQTDSAVNPGNSGGPLLTLDGKLIGITGQIMSRFGVKANTQIAYAIPIDQIARFYPEMKQAQGGVVYHGTIPEGMTFSSRLDETQMATVETVDSGSEAWEVGFRANDRVLSIDGKKAYNYARLVGIIRSYPEKTDLDVQIERGGRRMALKMKLPRMQLPPGPIYVGVVGVKIEQSRGNQDGIRIVNVDRNSPAEKAGLQPNDIVKTVDGKAANLEWHDLIAKKKGGEVLDLQVRRSAATLSVSIPIEKK